MQMRSTRGVLGVLACTVAMTFPAAGASAVALPPPAPAAVAQETAQAPTTTTEAQQGNAGSAAGQAPSARLDPRLAQATFAGFGAALLILLLRFATAGFRVRRLQAKAERKAARRENKERARAERLEAERAKAEHAKAEQASGDGVSADRAISRP